MSHLFCTIFLVATTLSTAIHAQKKKLIQPVEGIFLDLDPRFRNMTDDEIASKYPTYKKPLAMFISSDGSADFGINVSVNKWQTRNLEVVKEMYKSTFLSIFSEVDFKREGDITSINGRNFILFEFISKYTDENNKEETTLALKNYSYIAYTIYRQKILIFNFSCPFANSGTWAPVAHKMIHSLQITDKLELKEYTPFQVERPVPKGMEGDPQLKIIKGMKQKPKGN